MRKVIKITLIAVGIRALLRWRKSRKATESVTASTTPVAEPADELRRKLAESRDDDGPMGTPAPPEASVAERRTEVHEQGRAVLDEMKSSDEA